MTAIIQPKIEIPPGATLPDNYNEALGLVPHDNFVVSRNRDGSIASRYGDLSWNLTAYHADGRRLLFNFAYWKKSSINATREQLAREMRWLTFLVMYKNYKIVSISYVRKYLYLFRAIAQFCETNFYTIKDILTNMACLAKFIESGPSTGTKKTLSYYLSFLYRVGPEQTLLNVPSRNKLIDLRQWVNESKLYEKQTAPIPTRIYSYILSSLARELTDFEQIADRYLAMVLECSKNPFIGRCKETQNIKKKKLQLSELNISPDFKSLLRKYNLESYFSSKHLPLDLNGLSSGLHDVQMSAKLTIQAFSGMRDSESEALPYHCLDVSVNQGISHILILGRTTKFNKGLIKRTRWVSSQEGQRAIYIAQKIADTIYTLLNDKPVKAVNRINEYPLLVSIAYLPFTGAKAISLNRKFISGCFNYGNVKQFVRLKSRILPSIIEADICELEQIDLHRAWRTEEKFEIGKRWPLTTHQLRRSLALYAQRSGLVSLPSLRRQLQQITDEMALYYSRGSAYAANFLKSQGDDHFGWEWQNTAPVSSAMSFIINVLNSHDVLFGGYIEWLNRGNRTDGGVLVSREETLKRFKKGELSYRETSIGGCTNTDECKQSALKWIDVECLVGCTHFVGSLPKLERIIVAQTRHVNSLDQSSVEFRTDKSELEVLIAARDKVIREHEPNLGVI